MSLSERAMRRLAAMEICATGSPVLTVTLPGLRLESRANDHRTNHWGPRSKTSSTHRGAAQLVLAVHRRRLKQLLELRGLIVRMVRVGPRQLDSHDNLGMSLKALTDGVASVLQVDDRDERVEFVPDADRGPWAARIEFYEGDE